VKQISIVGKDVGDSLKWLQGKGCARSMHLHKNGELVSKTPGYHRLIIKIRVALHMADLTHNRHTSAFTVIPPDFILDQRLVDDLDI
jgi:hypothetical protein